MKLITLMEKIFLDMDGVTADFNRGCREKLGYSLHDPKFERLSRDQQHKILRDSLDTLDFWSELRPMPDFHQLWGFVKTYKPFVLSAYAEWGKQSKIICESGKKTWIRKHMMVPSNKINIVARADKQKYALDNTGSPNVLIDDKDKNITEWTRAGGIGILHVSALNTIQQLKQLMRTK